VAVWGVIPAAGSGARMMSAVPKQYLALHGESMLLRSCKTLVTNPAIDGVVVVLAKDDTGFTELPSDIRSKVFTTTGGATRAESVAEGVREVIKRSGETSWSGSNNPEQCVQVTVDRASLWQAQTPQMFRANALLDALLKSHAAGIPITDEASAMEYTGMNPLLVPALDPNFKVTQSADLELASAWLLSRSAAQK